VNSADALWVCIIRDGNTAPFDQGVVAARTGLGRDANPFEAKSDDCSDWNAGYETFKDADEAVEPKNT
jgi:hypothetical protein